MRKERNAFFEQQSYNQAYYPTPNMMNQNMPSIASTSSQSFFQGPNVNNTYQENDLDYRLAKIERQITRLDSRVSKLESGKDINMTENFNDNTNMYMV